MKPMTLVLFAGLLISGCVHRHVTIVTGREDPRAWNQDDPQQEAYDGSDGAENDFEEPGAIVEDDCEPAWDGHAWIEFPAHVHGPECGHFFYHDCWNCYPETHVFVEVGYAPCWETGGFVYRGESWARVWDGIAFLMLRGHIHGADCGHSYHDGCWNVFPRGHVYFDHGHRDFCASPPRARRDRAEERHEVRSDARREPARESRHAARLEAPVRGRNDGQPRKAAEVERPRPTARVERPFQGEPQKNERPARVEQPGKREQPQRVERPEKREQPQRIEQPVKREQPQRIERPEKREQPQRIEQPVKREQPQRIERPVKREQPQRIEQPVKREQPQRIEQPVKREQPQRIEQPVKREQPQRFEKPEKRQQPQRPEDPKKHEEPNRPERPK